MSFIKRGLIVTIAGASSVLMSVAAMATDIATPVTKAQKANLKLIRHWEETYNGDNVATMIKDCYAPDATVLFNGASVHGHEQFIKLEEAIKNAAPSRKMRIDRIRFAGDDVVVVEAVNLVDEKPDFYTPWAAILTIKGGKIVSDHTYLEPDRWPGIEAAKGIPTPHGLGSPEMAGK
jgi:ketosteroid isomerase-like protein